MNISRKKLDDQVISIDLKDLSTATLISLVQIAQDRLNNVDSEKSEKIKRLLFRNNISFEQQDQLEIHHSHELMLKYFGFGFEKVIITFFVVFSLFALICNLTEA